MDMSQNEVFFWFQKGFFERKKGHLILRQPPHTHTLIYIIYKYINLHTYIYIHMQIYIYTYTYVYINKFE